MDYIDIFLVNLKHRTDRKNQSVAMLDKYRFNIYLFEAIENEDGWKGCAESHLYLIRYAKSHNMDYIVVVEDDIDILVDPGTVSNIMNYLSKNEFSIFNGSPTLWDVRNNLLSIYVDPLLGSPDLASINWGQTTTFIVYNKSIYDYILENYHFDDAIDQFLSRMVKQTVYIGPTPFCKQRESYSDIQVRQSTYGDFFHSEHKKILNLCGRNKWFNNTIGIYGIFIGRYTVLYKDWIDNITKLFFPGTEKRFYIVTDDPALPVYNKTTFVYVTEYIGWPYETLYRFKYFLNFKACDIFESDIIYFINANGRFLIPVSAEVIPDKSGYVFTTHHCFIGKPYAMASFEKNALSSACVQSSSATYYAGGFYGATTANFLQMARTLDLRITSDEKKDYIACWHDESHINWYVNVQLKNSIRRLSVNFHVPQEYKDRYPDRILIYLYKCSPQLEEINREQYSRPRKGGKIIANKYNCRYINQTDQ